ncbi:MAG: hypothetical protein AB9903_31960 [Vulcanimicrobiota bacterium]
MELHQFLKHVAPFKIATVIILTLFTLTQFYSSFSAFAEYAKKEDSPENLNAAMVRGIISFTIAVALTGLVVWLAIMDWK